MSEPNGGKDRLMAAAERLFANRSYGDVGVAEVLATAGVKAPTLYHHYGDKEGLFVTWAETAFRKLGEAIRASQKDAATVTDALTKFAETLGGYKDLHMLNVLDDVQRLAKSESRERITRAYFDAVYEPCCMAILSAADSGAIKLEEIGPMSGAFLMGALGSSRRYALPATYSSDSQAWFVERFVRAFAP